MVYPIVKYPDSILNRPAAEVAEFNTPELRRLIDDMFESMYAASGVGLAAPQIGIGRRIAVIDCSAGADAAQQLVIINPKIVRGDGRDEAEEGCLSVPGFRANVVRAAAVTARAQDVEGNWREIEGKELLARALQHEIDHLDGILFLAHLTTLKRDMIKRKIRKLQKTDEW